MAQLDATAEVLGAVRRVRRRLVVVSLLEAGLSATLALLVLSAVVVLLASQDVDPTPLRWTLGIGIVGALAGATALAARSGLRRARSIVDVALLVEERVPGLHSGVVSTLEFAAAAPDPDPVSAALVERLAERTAERLRGIAPGALVDGGRAERAARLLGIAVTVLGVAGVVVPDPFRQGLHTLVEGRADAAAVLGPQSAVVEANVRDIRFRFVYPAYMRRPTRELVGAGGDIAAPRGTVVEVRATALRASRDAQILMGRDGGRTVPLTVEAGVDLAGSFTVQDAMTYRFRLVTRDSVRLDEVGSHTVDVEPDAAPEVRLLAPDKDLELNKQDRLTLVYQANDDVGLGQVDLVVRRAGAAEVRRRIATLDADLRHQGDAQLDLAETEAKPGETLEVWVEAFDQDTVSGPKSGRSEVRRVKIWSPEEKHEENVDRLAALVEVMLVVLADRLESPIDSLSVARWKEALDVSSSANARMEKVTKALDGVLTAIAEDPLMPPEVIGDLTVIRDREDELRRAEARTMKAALLLEAESPRQREHLTMLWTHNNESVDALEEDIVKLEDLVDRLRQEKLMTQTRDLLSQQGKLMELLDKLAKSGNAEDAAKAQKQIDALQDQLRDMMEQIAKQAKRLPYDNFNASALDPQGTTKDVFDFQKELDEIRDLLAQGRVEEAMKKAEELQKAMASLMSSMEEGFEGMSGGMSAEAHQKMTELDQKLGEVAAAEQAVHQGTTEVAESRQQAMQEAAGETLKEMLREQKEKADQQRQKLGEVGTDPMDPRDRDALDSGKEGMRELSERLGAEDVEQALQMAEQAAQQLGELAQELAMGADHAEEQQRAEALHEAGRTAKQAGKAAGEIAEALKELQPEPGEMMSPEDRQKMADLAGKQGEAQKKLGEAGQQMKEMGPMPGMEGLQQLLEGAGQSMEQAEQRLSEQRPGAAQRSEESALDSLDRARKRIQQMMKPQRGGGPGMGLSHERAEIPKAEDYQVPAEFREEVLKAMREGAPKRFEGMIQRYYEELIR